MESSQRKANQLRDANIHEFKKRELSLIERIKAKRFDFYDSDITLIEYFLLRDCIQIGRK